MNSDHRFEPPDEPESPLALLKPLFVLGALFVFGITYLEQLLHPKD